MTNDKNKKGAFGQSGDFRMMGTDTTLPVHYVRDRLRETEKVIKTLKSNLDYYRMQNNEIVKERNNLLELLSQKETFNEEQSQLEGDIMLVKNERDRLEDALSPIMDENKKLKDRCSRLEAVLVDEQEKHAETLEVIVYLEAQIEQLESMVEMLREHKRFMKGEEN